MNLLLMRWRTYVDDVHEFTREEPKLVSSWARADAIYRWIGCIVRPKRSYWPAGTTMPYGYVVEVGAAIWLGVLWSDGRTNTEYVGREVDCWHLRGVNELKDRMLARQVPDAELLATLRTLDPKQLILDRTR